MMGHNRWAKVTLVSFRQKSSSSAIGQFKPILGQNYASLCLRQFCLRICSVRILKCYSMMRYSSQTKAMFANLPKKFSFGARVKFTFLCLMIHSMRIFLKFYHIIGHNRQTKVALVKFLKNLLLGQYGPNLAQTYTTLLLINCSRDIQKHFSMMRCIIQTLVILVNFSKKFLFGARDNYGRNYATFFSFFSLRTFLK